MRSPLYEPLVFKKRLDEVAKKMEPNSSLVLPSHPEFIRNNDVEHPYRQDSNLFYLTGFEEPESLFVFTPGAEQEKVLFVRPKDKSMETWNGFRFGVEGAKEAFAMDAVFVIGDVEAKLAEILKTSKTVYYSLYQNKSFDSVFSKTVQFLKSMRGRDGDGAPSIVDPGTLLNPFRLVKTEEEINSLREACEISSQAHMALMKSVRPGMNERELEGLFIYESYKRGAARMGYNPIMAAGNNATTLHYVFNDCVIEDGDLVLVDAGAEYKYYTGDITRVFPANGRFNHVQKRIYDRLLAIQKSIIELVKPGFLATDFQNQAVKMLTELMVEEKLLKGSVDELIEKRSFAKYYPHGCGHWLGSDVHDVGRFNVSKSGPTLVPNMCFTVEPGIYIPADDSEAPEELRGLGLRIEDNIRVTEEGYENMTSSCPKTTEAIEDLMNH